MQRRFSKVSSMGQLKESLGNHTFSKIESLIQACLEEGLEVEISIPKDRVLKEGIFGNSIKGTKGKTLKVSMMFDKSQMDALKKVAGTATINVGNVKGTILRDEITFNIKNDKNEVLNSAKHFSGYLKGLVNDGKIKSGFGDFVVKDEKGNEVTVGEFTEYGGFKSKI